MEKGYGIETDVQLSQDGIPVLFHDYTLTRMCGIDKKVADCTLAELKSYPLAGTEQRIPTLAELLSLIDGKVPLLIELKGESTDTSLCPKAAELLDAYQGVYCVESFNPLLLRWFKKNRPDTVRGQLVTNLIKSKSSGGFFRNFMLSSMLTNFLSRPDFIAADEKYLKDISIRLCASVFGTKMFVWTVCKKEHFDINRENGDFSIFEGFEP
jgi:glycerophosphoryl diester phosphodiesterase